MTSALHDDRPDRTAAPDAAAHRLTGLIARAESAVRLSGTDPRLALRQARAVLAESRDGRHDEARSIALRACALAMRELGDLELAQERLHEAIAAGARFPRRAAQARMSLVAIRAMLGDPEDGLRLADLAEPDLRGTDLARLDVQRSVALMLLGRHREALRHCDRALGSLGGDPKFHAGCLLNRGVVRTYLEEYGPAEADLAECVKVARAAGLNHLAALAEGNLPFVAARRGDVAGAFVRYETAAAALSEYPERLAAMRVDFAAALVAAGLPGEARALLERALPDLAASGSRASIPDARLLLAQAELLAGDPRRARATARTALAELLDQGRAGWVPLATEVMLRARLAQGPPDDATVGALLSCADDLAVHGWAGAATSVRLTAARTGLALGRTATARAQLDCVIANAARPAIRQHALAMRLRLAGDLAGALAAARAGLEKPEAPAAPPQRRQVHAGATSGRDAELRARAARPVADLAAYGLELALETGDARTVLDWAERWRAIVRGRPVPPVPPGPQNGCLVELVRSADALYGVLVSAGRCVLRSLGSYSAAAEATIRIRYALRRRNLRDAADDDPARPDPAAGRTRPAGRFPAEQSLAAELAELDDRLLGPLGWAEQGDPPAGPVTVVPTGALYTLPWPLLPSLAGRPVSVAPDAAGPRGPAGPEPGRPGEPLVLAVAGPGLRHAPAEADLVVRAHPRAGRIGATRREVLAALERADVLHVAAHGISAPHSPMLSQIALDDGPLMAYELLRAVRVPRLVVLSACDAGMAHPPLDGAALGLAGAFLDRGAACVVAGIVPVRDDEALRLMTVFHALLAGGRPAAEALAAAAGRTGVAGFVCFGRHG